MELTERTDEHLIGIYGPVLVHWWAGPIPPEGARACFEAAKKLAERDTNNRAVLTIIESTASVPNTEARATFANIPGVFGNGLCSAIVIKGEGVRSTTMRLVGSAISMLSRTRMIEKLFDNERDGATWLAAHKHLELQADALLAALAEHAPAVVASNR